MTLLICKYCLIHTKNQKVHLEKFDTSEKSSFRNLSPRKSSHFENECLRKSDQFEIDHLSQIEKEPLGKLFHRKWVSWENDPLRNRSFRKSYQFANLRRDL